MTAANTLAINTGHLSTYLNDHLAGSVAALELIEYITKKFPESQLEAFLVELHMEVVADQGVLRDLLSTFDAKESTIRKAGAWLVEKMGRAKLSLTEHEAEGMGLLQALEGLVLGITGKGLLWRSLSAASQTTPQLKGPNYAELEERAVAQRNRVEEKRLAVARKAFRETADA